ncbi:sugar ABC transporter ATP-binding protein [Allobranchiibius sp. GilTou38]|uniref:sugar ABC transporter ATP-binding protein n=1 Tax=Allobranchiibius sp. GilTou38 TaxID=2815210 RepID=UPI001AA0F28B|nr:sugar ABC transporter ATP-binding protein [Allobranchiibius sp. GilTou38]MBO1766751.1 sugar ABC transporter ATP-binding protein [Allobranchiibius sp. GilTou38]
MRLEVSDISKSYGAVRALSGVSFDLRPGEVHALLGHNGAGKSTLVKVLAGLVQPDSGTVTIDGSVVEFSNPRESQTCGVALVDQELSLVPTLTVAENMLLGSHRGSRVKPDGLRRILDSLGLQTVPLGRRVSELTLGEQQLVEIARALSRDARILILDEPTATLSDHEIQMVFKAVRAMAADGRSIIYVSHRLGEILDLCQRATVFRDGRCIGTRSVAELDRGSLVEMMLGQLPDLDKPARPADGERPPVSIVVEHLHVEPRVADVSVSVAPGQIVGLAGQVGCGASEVLRALAGLEAGASGSMTVDGVQVALGSPLRSARHGVVYTTSDRKSEGLFLSHSIARNLVATRLPTLATTGVMSSSRDADAVSTLLQLTGIPADRRRQPVGTLSGGNQQKIMIARSLLNTSCRLLLLDEPTRGVDVGGRAEIHQLVRSAAAAGTSVIFSSTELDEVLELADTVVTMFGGRVVDTHPSDRLTPAKVLADMTHGPAAGAVA